MTLTTEQRRRTMEALTETCQKLEKEMSYSPDLRKNGMIDFYNSHIAKLNTMLDTNEWSITA